MTNDPYRNDPYGAGGSGDRPPGGSPPDESDAAWSRPSDTEATWSRPSAGSAPEPGGPPPGGPEAAQPTTQPPGSPPAGYPPAPPYQTPPYQTPPYQTPPYQTPPYQAQTPYQPPPGERRPTNAMAIVALVCSLAGVVTAISAPVGAVLGHIALRQIGQTGEEGAPLAKAAIWVGWIITGLIVAACCAVLVLAIVASRSGPDFAPR